MWSILRASPSLKLLLLTVNAMASSVVTQSGPVPPPHATGSGWSGGTADRDAGQPAAGLVDVGEHPEPPAGRRHGPQVVHHRVVAGRAGDDGHRTGRAGGEGS